MEVSVAQPGIFGVPWANIGWTALFAAVGLILMLVSVLIFDLLVPYRVTREISDGVEAVGWVVAGLLVSTGIVMHAAMRANAGLVQAVIYGMLGILLNYAGYYLFELITPHWSLNKAIASNNATAGRICAGLFVAIGLVVSGAFTIA